MKAFEGDLCAIGPKKKKQGRDQDANVLQISPKLAEMSENRQFKLLFCNNTGLYRTLLLKIAFDLGCKWTQASQVNAESEGVGLRVPLFQGMANENHRCIYFGFKHGGPDGLQIHQLGNAQCL
jgi:hypothetical protein